MDSARGKDRTRIRRLTIAAVAVIVASLAAAAVAVTIYSQLKSEIAEPQENYQWAAYQLQAEYLKLSLALEQSETGKITAEDLQTRYDIFVSRVLTLQNGEAYRAVRETGGFDMVLTELLAAEEIIDRRLASAPAHPAVRGRIISAGLAGFGAPLQRLSLEVVRDAAAEQTAHQLTLLDIMTYLVATLVVIISISSLLALVTIKQLGALHQGRRQLSKALERAEESSRAKSRFLASMSHEMRTPLNAMIGLLREIGYQTRTPAIREMADTATTSADMLCTLVDDVIDATRIETDKFRFNESVFDPEILMHEVAAMLAAPAQDRDNEILVNTEGLDGNSIQGDRGRMKQILVNLLTNAVKFTEDGTIRLRAVLHSSSGQRPHLLIDVTDSGIGIPEEEQHRIFERFAQVAGGEGLGIGLSITRALVERMNGTITLRSKPGEGSTFSVSLPVTISDVDVPIERQIFSEPLLVGLRLLVAEDNATNRQVVSHILRRHGASYVFARDGKEAVERAVEDAYDCILMDINMPKMDGLTAMKILKQRLNGSTPPVLALTADALPEDLDRFIESGMAGAVVKPISEPELLRRIGEVLGRADIVERCRRPHPGQNGASERETELTGPQREALAAFMAEEKEQP
ncbi:MAG: response regulator [Nisaea sp.]|uniref:ATP-binding protein n=1 Tax=Nisaea sp. TaxID=2024842 RepID=UPI001B23CD9C|nr:ATP-binding protein [Nisaea sp.]MBO6561538.1 response regulator [Nisaea sp.]